MVPVVEAQSLLVTAADTESAIISQVRGLEPVASAVIAAAGQAGMDVSWARTALADLENQVGAADLAVSGVSVGVLAQSAAGWPGNRAVFLGARNSLVTGQADLRAAYADGRAIVGGLGSRSPAG